MDLNEYQTKAMETRLPTATEEYALLGLAGEVGELYSLVAKAIRDDNPFSDDIIKKELGDILWFVAAISKDLGFTLDEVAQTNIDKLQKRKYNNSITGSGDDR